MLQDAKQEIAFLQEQMKILENKKNEAEKSFTFYKNKSEIHANFRADIKNLDNNRKACMSSKLVTSSTTIFFASLLLLLKYDLFENICEEQENAMITVSRMKLGSRGKDFGTITTLKDIQQEIIFKSNVESVKIPAELGNQCTQTETSDYHSTPKVRSMYNFQEDILENETEKIIILSPKKTDEIPNTSANIIINSQIHMGENQSNILQKKELYNSFTSEKEETPKEILLRNKIYNAESIENFKCLSPIEKREVESIDRHWSRIKKRCNETRNSCNKSMLITGSLKPGNNKRLRIKIDDVKYKKAMQYITSRNKVELSEYHNRSSVKNYPK